MKSATSDNPGGIVLALVALLAALAALFFCWPAWRAQWPLEIDGNEAWNAFLVGRLQSGLPLYPARGELISNNYPPLSFLALQALAKVGLHPIPAGRILSLLAVVFTAGGIGWIARLFGAGTLAIAIASAWYVGTMARFFDTYVGMNDPNLPALAIMIWGMGWITWSHKNGKAVEPGFALLVLAGFYKNSLFAVPLTSLIWLALQDRRRAIRAALFSAASVVLGLAICVAIFGENFVAQLTAPRTFRIGHFIASLGRMQFVLPALVISLWWTLRNRRFAPAQFAALFIILALASHCLQQFGDGIDDNSQFELIAALAVALGLAFHYGTPAVNIRRSQIAIVAILIVRLLLSNRTEPYLLLSSKDYRDIGPA